MLFRKVDLRPEVKGQLYLHSMPGRNEPLSEAWAEAKRLEVKVLIRLAPMDEVRQKSPSYAKALEAGAVPFVVHPFPICDFSSPDNDRAFADAARTTADSLRAGNCVLVHCGAGIGRTGLFAAATLMALGMALDEAKQLVKAARSQPENDFQQAALTRVAQLLSFGSA